MENIFNIQRLNAEVEAGASENPILERTTSWNFSDNNIGIPLSFILSAHQLAQEENLWRGYGLTPNELFKLILSSNLAYAYGHTLDQLFGTMGNSPAYDEKGICTEAQQTAIKKIKSTLLDYANSACKK